MILFFFPPPSIALEQKFPYPESIAHILLARSMILYLVVLNWLRLSSNLDYPNHGAVRQIWEKKIKKKITHLKTETTGHSRVESHCDPTQGLPHLCPTFHCPVQHLPHEHLALCFATCTELSHAAALPSMLTCCCRRKKFLLHVSKPTAEGK